MERATIESLEFKDFSFRYEDDELLFENINIQLPMNQYVRFRTESGRGSSTILLILAALRQGEGSYLINGQNASGMSFEEFLPYRLSIGYGFDFGGLINNKTLKENLMLPLEYHKAASEDVATKWVMELLDRLGVAEYADRRPAMVTGGVRKTACILRALVLHPELLLLDDPTTGLNVSQVKQFMDLLNDLRDGGHLKHVFFVSQNVEFLSGTTHCEIFAERSGFTQIAEDTQVAGL